MITPIVASYTKRAPAPRSVIPTARPAARNRHCPLESGPCRGSRKGRGRNGGLGWGVRERDAGVAGLGSLFWWWGHDDMGPLADRLRSFEPWICSSLSPILRMCESDKQIE